MPVERLRIAGDDPRFLAIDNTTYDRAIRGVLRADLSVLADCAARQASRSAQTARGECADDFDREVAVRDQQIAWMLRNVATFAQQA
jgi:hypothetical protein